MDCIASRQETEPPVVVSILIFQFSILNFSSRSRLPGQDTAETGLWPALVGRQLPIIMWLRRGGEAPDGVERAAAKHLLVVGGQAPFPDIAADIMRPHPVGGAAP